MKLSELGDKEIVNLSNGGRYGELADAELLFEERSGKIKAILAPEVRSKFHFGGGREFIQLPWNTIRKIGEDIIIFESD